MKQIQTVGVVGAGTMGSALAQKFAQEGFRVILADREMRFIEKGLNAIRAMLNEGVEKKVFSPEQVQGFFANLSGTENLADLIACDLVVEAIFEDFEAKSALFRQISDIVPAETILATNTSSFSVTELAASVAHPERFIGLHYFYHAAKNRLVEIIPGSQTSQATYEAVRAFSMQAGKDAITTKDAYGFAVNRFFVPWLNESCKLLGDGVASVAEIDAVCMKTFGIGMGPFALMNATGVPIALHAQKTLEHFGPSYKVSETLANQVASGQNWDLTGTGTAAPSPETLQAINNRMLGCVMFVCSQILAEEVCNATDLNRGAKIGLKWRLGPVDLMYNYGEAETKRLAEIYAHHYGEPKIPTINAERWAQDFVTLELKGNIAVLTMARPEDMNALNEETMRRLDEQFSKAEAMPEINTIIITGSGKAFVAGADIKFFINNIKNKSLDKIVSFTRYGQNVFEKIDKSPKTVVALLNGITLGGGLELALCADYIFALPKATVAFPETGIGIYPGLGGTQRSAYRVGKGLAKYLILTGAMTSSSDAAAMGLIDGVISYDEMFVLIAGKQKLPERQNTTVSEPFLAIAQLFETNSYEEIIKGSYTNTTADAAISAKLCKIMSYKAPIAMQIAERLIDEAKGAASELKYLESIFSTNDALLGLTSIGKQPRFSGT